ncbi:MAG: YbaK/prolyl-tRNA synthetase like protein, partial [Actinotalea sp.]|nr:YbaK/prolyl-tRNA synthetase like protein [Actinotalea sp.]
SGAARVDTALVAAQLDLPPLRRASAELVLEHTGQVVGGVAPVGHPRPIPTVVDVALREHAVVWAGAGDVRTMFPTTFTELVALTGGRPLQVR